MYPIAKTGFKELILLRRGGVKKLPVKSQSLTDLSHEKPRLSGPKCSQSIPF